ncbi:MAG: hypothetical protein ACJAZ2_001665 [Glaciecola sp.]|jgi:hypothetical protein
MREIFFIVSFFAVLSTQFSCKKENDEIGLNPGGGILESASIDTFQLNTYSKYSQNTSSNSGTSVFIGGYNTDELGTIKASTYTSVAPTDLTFRIPEGGVTVTSVSLSIRVTEAYGNPFPQEFKVSKTTSSVSKDVNYLTSDSLSSENSSIGTFTIDNSDTGAVLIALDKTFGEEIFAVGDVIFTTSELFIDVFKGLSIIPTSTYSTNTGSVYAIDASDIILTVNYTQNTASTAGSVSFTPTSNSRSFYNSTFDQEVSEVKDQFSNNAIGNTNFYVQGLGGVKSSVEIASLLSWFKSGNFLINKAIVTIPANINGSFTTPTSLTIHKESDSSSDGVQAIYDEDKKQYVFDIESLISERLLAGEEAIFELSILNTFAHPEQVKLNGSGNASVAASIVIHYTNY